MNKKKLIITIFLLSIIIASISIFLIFTSESGKKPLKGECQLAEIGGEFTLTDQDNREFGSDQMMGRVSLVYFGFTFCPDICPTSLDKIVEVISTLEKYQMDILPIFITIDPKRDTTEILKEYLSSFHSKIIGLNGTKDEVKKVADLYKAFYAISDESSDHYMVDHSSFIYLMNSRGEYVKHFYFTSTKEEIINYIRTNKHLLFLQNRWHIL